MTISLRDRNRLAAMDEVRSVAFDLMDANGFDAVTVEQIASHSSVSPSTIYRYFGTKEALVLSAQRPTLLVDRLRRDESARSALAAFARAATKVWGGDDAVAVELGLISANPALVGAWERQLLDQRSAVADAFAVRRSAKSTGTRDEANAAAAVAILMTMLLKWQTAGGGRKSLDKLLTKAFSSLDI